MSTTQIENEIPRFVYEPLPDAGSYIRLITILDFDETRPIPVHCKLTVWPVSEAPKYHAISYVWGDANHTATILINGDRMQVTQNCEYTLRQATWYGGNFRRRYYWVDAICIDQSSNEEKGPQVTLMGDIYKNAERVLACVGKCNAGSKYLYRRLRRDSSLFRELGLSSGIFDPRISAIDWDSIPRSTWYRMFHELADFLGRLYFSRVWIYQELCLGRQISVCCGKEHLSLRALHGLTISSASWSLLSWPESVSRNDIAFFIDSKLRLIRDGALNPGPMLLTSALEVVEDLKCTDSKDRIYGILSVVDWSSKDPIYPDYTKDNLEIAMEALRIISREEPLWDGHVIVGLIMRSLDLVDDPSPRLREAIQRRRLGSPRHLANINPTHCLDTWFCSGWCLAYEDGGWKFEGDTGCVPISAQQQPEFLRRRGRSQPYGILLPSVTRPGDWCMFPRYEYYFLSAFIARPRADGHFDIVGQAMYERVEWFRGEQDAANFDLHIDYEDAIVILSTDRRAASLKPFDGSLDDRIIEYLETRVCGQLGSSYAVMRKPGGRNDSWEDARNMERNMRFS